MVSMIRMSTVCFVLVNGLAFGFVLSFRDCLMLFGSSLMIINRIPTIRSWHGPALHFVYFGKILKILKFNTFGSIFLVWLWGFQSSDVEIYSLLTTCDSPNEVGWKFSKCHGEQRGDPPQHSMRFPQNRSPSSVNRLFFPGNLGEKMFRSWWQYFLGVCLDTPDPSILSVYRQGTIKITLC